ncbi:TPA: methyltransferase domain-containing protein, partial [Streptococcus agalactiae]|nr:methyltransferase domain-containing protein [Streptococcus agalactiae]HEN6477686.1 methyltransferase domain-containing protein [Streptococcus agalactiae]
MTNVTSYKEMLAKPWGKIQYEITFAQLSHIKNQNVLDFGAGFCLTEQHLAKENNVTAIEPNPKLLYDNQSDNIYKILGSYEALRDLPDQSFDTIICHNVL